jgi:hypothetical protein
MYRLVTRDFLVSFLLVVLLALAPAGSVASADQPGGTVDLVVSNLRYCREHPCRATDSAYLRGPAGPIPGTDNPAAIVEVAPGENVIWTYRDDACDLIRCAGHEVRFEDGTPQGTVPVGYMPSGPARATITWVVPADASPGSVIRYFCNVETHWKEGLTGGFRVVAKSFSV